MGLDAVELILRIEDEFSIAISDEEAGAVRTVGDLYDVVLGKLTSCSSCASGKAFYMTRTAIVDTMGLPRRLVGPSTWLEPLLPQSTRIERWKEIAARSKLAFPHLEHPRSWRDGFMLLSMALAAIPVIAVWWSLYVLDWLPGILVWMFAIPALVGWVVLISRINQRILVATPRLAYEIPFKTAGDLAKGVLAMNYKVFDPLGGAQKPLGSAYIWKRIVEIYCDQLKVDAEDVRLDARIVGDLGVD